MQSVYEYLDSSFQCHCPVNTKLGNDFPGLRMYTQVLNTAEDLVLGAYATKVHALDHQQWYLTTLASPGLS